MVLPRPSPGLVVRYEFLWAEDAETGTHHPADDHPCVVLLSVGTGDDARVLFAAVTHSEPSYGLEIPLAVRRSAGLDDRRQWVSLEQFNEDRWPLGLSQIPGKGGFVYGRLTEGFFRRLVGEAGAAIRRRRAALIRRSE